MTWTMTLNFWGRSMSASHDGEILGPVEDDEALILCDGCTLIVNGEHVYVTTDGRILCQGCDDSNLA